MFKNTYFEEHLRAAASEPNSKFNMNKVGFVILHIYEKHKFSHKNIIEKREYHSREYTIMKAVPERLLYSISLVAFSWPNEWKPSGFI